MNTRLMIVHTRVLFRTSLAHLLAQEPDFELVAECANTAEAIRGLPEAKPDIIVFDFGIWRDLVPSARKADYQGTFMAIAEEVDPALCARAISDGVSGVFHGCDSPARLVQAIRLVVTGEVWLDRNVIQLLAERYPHHEDLHLDALAGREQAVLRGILDGLTNRKIADQIGASEATVKATLQQLFDKTGVRKRSQLVRIILADPDFSGVCENNRG
jgi:two-component system nitrate/nitrite response regulator NarL